MILDKKQVIMDEVVSDLCVNHGSGHGIIQDQVRFNMSAQNGFQNNSQENTSATVCQDLSKTKLTCVLETQCHWGWGLDSPLRSKKRTPEYGMETSEIQNSKFNDEQEEMLAVYGIH
jgi:hypothetical protein